MKHTGQKDPAMLLYGDDFYADEAVKLMSHEQEAIYLRLLWHAWREGSIPGDIADLAALVDVSPTRFRKLWPRIAVKWVPAAEPGRLVNPRQEHERRERIERSRRLSEAGISGNAKRWGRRSPGDQEAIQPSDRQAIPSSTNRSERVSEGARARETGDATGPDRRDGPDAAGSDPAAEPTGPPAAAPAPHSTKPAVVDPEEPRPAIVQPGPAEALEHDPGSAALREALLDRGVLRASPRRLDALVAAMTEAGWTPDDVAEAAETVGGKNPQQRAGRLASLLLDDERRVAFGDDLARRQAQQRRARA